MQKWVPYAMVRITLYLVCGILLAIYQPQLLSISTATLLLVVVCALAFIFFLISRRKKRYQVAFGITSFIALVIFGYIHLYQNTKSNHPDNLIHLDGITAYECIVRSAPESKANSWKLYAEVVQAKTQVWKPVTGKVVLYISKKSIAKIPWLYGDHLLIEGTPQKLKPPANPNEFDFRRFLTFKSIYHQQFLKANQVQFVAPPARKGFIYYSHRVRDWASTVIHTNIKGDQNQAVAMALILGVTEGIDNELLSAYAASGAMHVLAVSGMHVGIIYVIILFLFKPLKKFQGSAWLVAAISIFLLWSFAFVTGLSPSVLRAVTMFSFVALAKPLGWRTNIYNTLATSAFVLLLYDPYLIMSVGFQLSYLAVLGIVYIQRPLYNLWLVDSSIGNWIWEITCISIAAQIATFALGMLYFHQFPVYFLVSNLFVIPLSTAVLVGGILLLTLSWIPLMADLMGWLLQWLIELLNWTVITTEKLPFSIISGIHITTFQCWVIMGILFSLILMLEYRRMKLIGLTIFLCAILLLSQVQHFNQNLNVQQFVVYSVSNHTAMEWISQGKSYYRADSALLQDTERTRFHILPNRLQHGVKETHQQIPFEKIYSGYPLYRWQNQTIAVMDKRGQPIPSIPIDYLVISNHALSLRDTVHLPATTKLILDGTNSSYYIARWKQAQQNKPWQVHAVADEGAFVLNN
ncbi:MAG TPA: ComEC/Rec2 family competence protein [Cyclobacteriaceae bacterium]|nr:ComEC/Rec2 family competence protein [Cyclobacteriaceae bacterium]HNU42371.1 ComEC/Rec2 family competence protein [Cyclobacteriaceae bacterium]